MSISKIFKPNFVCPLTNKRYKTYQGFSFSLLGHAPRVGLGGAGGGGSYLPVCLSHYLLLNHRTKSNPIQCVCYSQEGVCHSTFFWPYPPGVKRSNVFKLQLNSQFQRFFNQTLCLLSNKRYKTSKGIFIWSPGSCPQEWVLGCWAAGVKN